MPASTAAASGWPTGKLEDFRDLTAAKKRDFVTEYPLLRDRIGVVMNNRLRNAFGHNTADFDYAAQRIKYPSGSRQAEVTFAAMAALAMAATVRLYQMALIGLRLWPELT